MMSREEALYQSLAASAATVIAFIGLAHELAGHIIFPWGPDFLGGPVGWHATGLAGIVIGLALVVGALRLIKFPVVAFALIVTVIGIALVIATAVLYEQFHAFALVASVAGFVTAFCHRRAEQRASS